MGELKGLQERLGKVTHSSQLTPIMGDLLRYLQKREERETRVQREQVHQRIAQAVTEADLDQLVQEAGPEDTDEEFYRAVDQRRQVLSERVAEGDEPNGNGEAAERVYDFEGLSKPELKAQAKARGVPTSGTVEELKQRLTEHDAAASAAAGPADEGQAPSGE